VRGKAIAIPALEGEAQRIAHRSAEVEALDEHVGDFASRFKVVDGPRVGGLLDHLNDLLALLLVVADGGEGDDVVHHLGGICRVVDEGLGADSDFVAENRGHLVGVAGAADVAEQSYPINGVSCGLVQPRRIANPCSEQTRPHLRFQRLAECVVLCQGQGGDELT
jgi:hypothetical protein